MANADKIYVDPSALRRLYVHDLQSRAFCTWRRRVGGTIPLTLHGRAELINSVCLAVFRGDLTLDDQHRAFGSLEADLRAGRLVLADVPWRQTLQRAAELSAEHPPRLGTRTLNALHVASALALESRSFVTYDLRQIALAKAAGLRVSQP